MRKPHLGEVLAAPNNAICPSCRQRAPIRLRGVEAFCAVCGAKRTPFTALNTKALNLAGKPSRWGGTAAKVIGTLILVMGLTFTVSLGLIVYAIASTVGIAVGVSLPFLVLTLLFGGGFLFGSRKLRQQGDQSERQAQLETVRALAAHRGGNVTAYDVATALQLPEAKADEMLTELAKDPEGDVTLELDAEGRLRYLFGATDADRWRLQMPRRIDAGAPMGSPGQRIGAQPSYDTQAEAEAYAAEMHASGRARR